MHLHYYIIPIFLMASCSDSSWSGANNPDRGRMPDHHGEVGDAALGIEETCHHDEEENPCADGIDSVPVEDRVYYPTDDSVEDPYAYPEGETEEVEIELVQETSDSLFKNYLSVYVNGEYYNMGTSKDQEPLRKYNVKVVKGECNVIDIRLDVQKVTFDKNGDEQLHHPTPVINTGLGEGVIERALGTDFSQGEFGEDSPAPLRISEDLGFKDDEYHVSMNFGFEDRFGKSDSDMDYNDFVFSLKSKTDFKFRLRGSKYWKCDESSPAE